MKKRFHICVFTYILGLLSVLSQPALAQWSTATLSKGRYISVATTAGDKALFAGGQTHFNGVIVDVTTDRVDIYDRNNNQWSTAQLSKPELVQPLQVQVA